MNTKKEMKNTSKHVCYNAARYEAPARRMRSRMHENKEVQLRGHHDELKTHEGEPDVRPAPAICFTNHGPRARRVQHEHERACYRRPQP